MRLNKLRRKKVGKNAGEKMLHFIASFDCVKNLSIDLGLFYLFAYFFNKNKVMFVLLRSIVTVTTSVHENAKRTTNS